MWPEDTTQSRIFKHKSGCECVEKIRRRQKQSCHPWISFDCITSLCHTVLPFTSVSTCAFMMVLSDGLLFPSWLLKLQSGRRRAPVALCLCVCLDVCRRATITYYIATMTVVPTFPAFHVTHSTVESISSRNLYIRWARAVAGILWPVRASWCRHRVVTIFRHCQCWLEKLCSTVSSW